MHDKLIKREIFGEIAAHLKAEEITVITGARQTGKTTLFLQLKDYFYCFIDEVQRLENAGRFLKGIYDLKLPVKFVVSGSSSLEMKAKISEPLTGRKRIFHLWPFSFSEYILWGEPSLSGLLTEESVSAISREKIMGHFFDYVIFGGYPKVVLSS